MQLEVLGETARVSIGEGGMVPSLAWAALGSLIVLSCQDTFSAQCGGRMREHASVPSGLDQVKVQVLGARKKE